MSATTDQKNFMCFIGHFKDNKGHGYGRYTFVDGSVKEGLWENGDFMP